MAQVNPAAICETTRDELRDIADKLERNWIIGNEGYRLRGERCDIVFMISKGMKTMWEGQLPHVEKREHLILGVDQLQSLERRLR